MKALFFVLPLALFGTCDNAPTGQGNVAVTDTILEPDALLTEEPPVGETLFVEKTAEALRLVVYEAPAGFPLSFRTQVPADLSVLPASSGEGHAVRFEMGEATLNFFVLPKNTSEGDARSLARSAVGSDAKSVGERPPDDPWALAMFENVAADARVRSVQVGRHAGRYFYFQWDYPTAYVGDFAPRSRAIVDNWRWEDGRKLGEPAS
ncbi:MAG: hypothetical protein WBA12_16000 [Catalinimonas sp.]